MAALNKVMLIGHLGNDPGVKNTQSGTKVCNLSIATSESWKDKQTGEKKERTEWHRIVIWNEGLVGIAQQYLKKGSKVYICGKLQTRKWTDQQNIDRYTTEIVLQGFDCQLIMLGDAQGNKGEASARNESSAQSASDTPIDDEIPF
jgi:single-strand DNA-binding protein